MLSFFSDMPIKPVMELLTRASKASYTSWAWEPARNFEQEGGGHPTLILQVLLFLIEEAQEPDRLRMLQ